MKKIKALGLFSGGLDSWLAALVLKEQGIDISLLHFYSPFFGFDEQKRRELKLEIEKRNMHLITYQIKDDYINKVLINPKYGYGSSCNACIDCHAYMLNIANEIKQKKKFDFIFTGDVLGQRPMSQKKDSLNCVEKIYGIRKEILRPLSAKLLPVTIPEEKGFVKKDKLLGIQGRSRKEQISLAKKYNLKDYLNPGGGCKFTDKNIKKRFFVLKSLFNLNWEILLLLKIGRHILVNDKIYFIISRDEKEYFSLKKFFHLGIEVRPKEILGAVGLVLSKKLSKNDKVAIGELLSRYTKATRENKKRLKISFLDNEKEIDVLEVDVIKNISKEVLL